MAMPAILTGTKGGWIKEKQMYIDNRALPLQNIQFWGQVGFSAVPAAFLDTRLYRQYIVFGKTYWNGSPQGDGISSSLKHLRNGSLQETGSTVADVPWGVRGAVHRAKTHRLLCRLHFIVINSFILTCLIIAIMIFVV